MIVLDASALVDVVLDQPNKPMLLTHFDQQLAAPAHQPVEVLSALARLRRAGQLTAHDAREALRQAASLTQELVPMDRGLLERSLELDGRIRVVDAVYVALAERFECPLLTSDRRLAASDPPCEVVLVSASPVPDDPTTLEA